MRPETAVLATLLLLAACGEQAATPPPEPTVAAPAAAPAPTPASYVGRWAASSELCTNGAWVFEPRALSTAGEVSCRFERVTPTATGFEVDARCVAQAPETRHTFTLTLTDPAPPQAMTVSGGPWSGAVTLMRCGPRESHAQP